MIMIIFFMICKILYISIDFVDFCKKKRLIGLYKFFGNYFLVKGKLYFFQIMYFSSIFLEIIKVLKIIKKNFDRNVEKKF